MIHVEIADFLLFAAVICQIRTCDLLKAGVFFSAETLISHAFLAVHTAIPEPRTLNRCHSVMLPLILGMQAPNPYIFICKETPASDATAASLIPVSACPKALHSDLQTDAGH